MLSGFPSYKELLHSAAKQSPPIFKSTPVTVPGGVYREQVVFWTGPVGLFNRRLFMEAKLGTPEWSTPVAVGRPAPVDYFIQTLRLFKDAPMRVSMYGRNITLQDVNIGTVDDTQLRQMLTGPDAKSLSFESDYIYISGQDESEKPRVRVTANTREAADHFAINRTIPLRSDQDLAAIKGYLSMKPLQPGTLEQLLLISKEEADRKKIEAAETKNRALKICTDATLSAKDKRIALLMLAAERSPISLEVELQLKPTTMPLSPIRSTSSSQSAPSSRSVSKSSSSSSESASLMSVLSSTAMMGDTAAKSYVLELLFHILKEDGPEGLLQLCTTSKAHRDLCKSEAKLRNALAEYFYLLPQRETFEMVSMPGVIPAERFEITHYYSRPPREWGDLRRKALFDRLQSFSKALQDDVQPRRYTKWTGPLYSRTKEGKDRISFYGLSHNPRDYDSWNLDWWPKLEQHLKHFPTQMAINEEVRIMFAHPAFGETIHGNLIDPRTVWREYGVLISWDATQKQFRVQYRWWLPTLDTLLESMRATGQPLLSNKMSALLAQELAQMCSGATVAQVPLGNLAHVTSLTNLYPILMKGSLQSRAKSGAARGLASDSAGDPNFVYMSRDIGQNPILGNAKLIFDSSLLKDRSDYLLNKEWEYGPSARSVGPEQLDSWAASTNLGEILFANDVPLQPYLKEIVITQLPRSAVEMILKSSPSEKIALVDMDRIPPSYRRLIRIVF